MTIIETTNLTKHYGDTVAVDGMDLTVSEGSIHGFVGPNGAGKTTAMEMLVGHLTPTEGQAHIGGDPAGSMAARQKLGYSPQEPSFYESMTGRAYLEYLARVSGVDQPAERSAELLSWVNLTGDADKQVGGYSGGMKRRLSLAQAMVHDPELLILDEPTAGLDPSGRRTIIESLQELTEEGLTVFVSSHVLAELEQFIDTVTILIDGEHIETDTVDAIQQRYGVEAYLIETSNNKRVVSLLADCSWVSNVSLEDGHLRVTTDDPDRFRSELQSLLADEGVLLESLQEAGGLEDAFADVIQQTAGSDGGEP